MKTRRKGLKRGFSLFEIIIAGIFVDGLLIFLIFGLI